MKKQILGMDYGTTNSEASVIDDAGQPRPLKNSEGHYITPSCICFTPSGEIVVGQEAQNLSTAYPESYISEAKRLLGMTDSDGKPITVYVDKDGKHWTAEECAALVIKKLKADAEAISGSEFSSVLITVPASFSEVQRQAVINAGRIAGFSDVEVMDEPSAAAYSYGVAKESGTYLIYDLGGGTFDVTLVRVDSNANIEILGTDGQTDLGGTDWSNVIAVRVQKEIDTLGIDKSVLEDPAIRYEIKDRSQKLKHTLSTRTEGQFNMMLGSKRVSFTYTRQEFEGASKDLCEHTMQLVSSTLVATSCPVADVDGAVLVGGGTRMPQIVDGLSELLGKPVSMDEDPDLVVAKGAALSAAKQEQSKGTKVLSLSGSEVKSLPGGKFSNCAAHDLGCKAFDANGTSEEFAVIIKKNTSLPATRTETFKMKEIGQTAVSVSVYQGKEGSSLAQCLHIDDVLLDGLPSADANEERIVVEYGYSLDGIVHVTVTDKISGKSRTADISHNLGMTAKEVKAAAAHLKKTKLS